MSAVTLSVLLYVAAQLGLGFWVSRRVSSEDDYLLAGRSLGYGLVIFSVFATWFGAETCIGAAGEAYQRGLSGSRADPFGYAVAMVVMGLFIAVPLWRRKLTTIADLFRERFGQTAERLAVLALVPASVLWAAAQIRAFGTVLGATSDMSTTVSITIAASVVIAYTVSGGLLADAWTDVVQGIVLIIGLGLVAGAMVVHGHLGAIADAPPSHLDFFATDRSLLDTLEAWSIPILGSLVAQELIARILGSRTPQIARRSTLIASVLYLAVGIIPILIGLAAAVVAPGISDPEQVLIHQAERYLPTILYIVFAGALVSAILSTVDSALLSAGSLFAHNLVLPVMPGASPRTRLRLNRVAVVTAGLIAYAIALSGQTVYELVEQSAAFGSSGALVALLFGLFTRFGGAASACASLVAGIVVYAACTHLLAADHPFLISLAASVVAYAGGALVRR